jgi:iron complex transport system substrate-binding protein
VGDSRFSLPPARRIVSLVPSITESLFELDLGDRVVGITDYCVFPAQALANLPRLGGPKNPRVPEILALQPDLVIADQEENTPEVVQALEASGVFVWLTFPQTVADALDVLWILARLHPDDRVVMRLRLIENTLQWVETAAASLPPLRFFCPIWQDQTTEGTSWWMTFNRYTYASDLLTRLGGVNVFADRDRRYPLEADLGQVSAQPPGRRDTRYPHVTRAEILAADPELILLPSEPFAYASPNVEEMLDLFVDTSAARSGRVHLVDGSLITWSGIRLGLALRELPSIFVSPE